MPRGRVGSGRSNRKGAYVFENAASSHQRREVDFPEIHIEPYEVTENDRRNWFYAYVMFPKVPNVSDFATQYNVIGRENIDSLSKRVAHALWLDNKIWSPEVAVQLYENGVRLDPDTILAQLLKNSILEKRGDHISLHFKCLVHGFWGDVYQEEA